MKKAIVLAVALTALGLWLIEGSETHTLAAGAPAAECGDLNSDGSMNLGDVIYLLLHLFKNGPPPSCPTHTCALPDTGQTPCYDAAGNQGPCGDAACPGQDGVYATGGSVAGRFIDNGDGTVTDTETGLMWIQANLSGVCNPSNPVDWWCERSWCEALQLCENLVFAGHDDWRLPNVRELQSIIDYSSANLQSIPLILQGGNDFGNFWTSTTVAFMPDHAWRVEMAGGAVSITDNKSVRNHVRIVRSL